MNTETSNRRLSAILAADVVGFSSMMAKDESATMESLKKHRKIVLDPLIEAHGGRIVKLMGDGVLVEFSSVVAAVQSAIAIQQNTAAEDGPIQLRIGVNLGDVIIDGSDIYGDGVNVAARLESLASTGAVCISDIVYQSLTGKRDMEFKDLGEQQLKNIDRPVRVWQWLGAADPSRAKSSFPGEHKRPSIAVLAFTNMSGDPEQEYFSDGISEDIITELCRFDELFVIARNSSFSYKGKSTKIQKIAEDLGIDYVVEGSVRRSGQRVRITVQLIEATSGSHIWAERYDRELEDIFNLQDEITKSIVTVLPLRLSQALIEVSNQKSQGNLSAYEYVLRARWLENHTSHNVPEMLDLLDKALELDPESAHAYSMIAFIHAYSVFTFSPIGEDPTITAVEKIEKALELAENDHFVQTSAGHVYLICGQHDLAKIHIDRSLTINPNDLWLLLNHGIYTNYCGDHERGIQIIKNALAHDPLAPDHWLEALAEATYVLGTYDDAIELYLRWKNPPVHMYTHLAACHAQLGNMDKAQEAAALFEKERPPESDFTFYANSHARLCKHPEDAEHWLEGYRKAGLID
ncbi:MAG: adenylate/guanylate cyclase domain-containing protein [Pseudomonadota bacterium]